MTKEERIELIRKIQAKLDNQTRVVEINNAEFIFTNNGTTSPLMATGFCNWEQMDEDSLALAINAL